MNRRVHCLLASFSIPFLASCASMVTIESPSTGCPGDAQPIGEMRVRFHQRFQPGSFVAILKRRDPPIGGAGLVTQLPDIVITQSFGPVPMPGSISTASGVSFDPKVYAFRVTGDSSPAQAFDGLSDERAFQAPSLRLSLPGDAHPGAGGTCESLPRGLAQTLMLNSSITIGLWIPRTLTTQGSLTVSLSPNNNNVALQGQAPGASTAVTWNASNRQNTSFIVTGKNVGDFVITVSAPGYQTTTLSGHVSR